MILDSWCIYSTIYIYIYIYTCIYIYVCVLYTYVYCCENNLRVCPTCLASASGLEGSLPEHHEFWFPVFRSIFNHQKERKKVANHVILRSKKTPAVLQTVEAAQSLHGASSLGSWDLSLAHTEVRGPRPSFTQVFIPGSFGSGQGWISPPLRPLVKDSPLEPGRKLI